jgi:nitrite reductase/ring-hydroxylating ferredoxin subunit
MRLVVGRLAEQAPGNVTTADVEGQKLAVTAVDGKYFAFVDRCTHLGCPLSDGPLDGRVITCRCHESQFDVTNGSVVTGPAKLPIETYELTVIGDELQLVLGEEEEEEAAAEPTPAKAPAPAAGVAPPRTEEDLVLARVPFFEGLDQAALDSLRAFVFKRSFKAGDLIVEEGRTGNGAYIVLAGQVEVVKGLEGPNPQVIARLGPGEPFGEMALLGDWPRIASVRAVEDCECLGMDRWIFLAYLNRQPSLAIKMLQVLARRLADADARLSLSG